jgi:hypothetical protein
MEKCTPRSLRSGHRNDKTLLLPPPPPVVEGVSVSVSAASALGGRARTRARTRLGRRRTRPRAGAGARRGGWSGRAGRRAAAWRPLSWGLGRGRRVVTKGAWLPLAGTSGEMRWALLDYAFLADLGIGLRAGLGAVRWEVQLAMLSARSRSTTSQLRACDLGCVHAAFPRPRRQHRCLATVNRK